mgnify:CR=1 FL=1
MNKAFRNTARAWTVQRKDVDNFYGMNFESEFVIFQDAPSQAGRNVFEDALIDREINKKLSPKILLDGQQIDYFLAKGKIPERFTLIGLERQGEIVPLVLKINREAVIASVSGDWKIEISKDLRVAAFVSLVKSAYLTLFDMFGYGYALTAAGEFVGQQILGQFFRRNNGLPKPEVMQNAYPFFRDFALMVRPIQSSIFGFRGTITDKTVLVCWGSGDLAWAMIVIIRIGKSLHAVMLPVSGHLDMLVTFIGFLKSENENITVSLCRFKQDHWEMDKQRMPLIWPKSGLLYPE